MNWSVHYLALQQIVKDLQLKVYSKLFILYVFTGQQVEVIKKAYLQETDGDCEDAEVSPMEVGHNIYILALQVHV